MTTRAKDNHDVRVSERTGVDFECSAEGMVEDGHDVVERDEDEDGYEEFHIKLLIEIVRLIHHRN